MTEVERLAGFVSRCALTDLSAEAQHQLKLRVMDSLGVAIGAIDAEPMRMVRRQTDELGGRPIATLIGGGASAPDRAAFYNGALVRYLDYMDSYLAVGETCHPSDNLAPVLAAAEYAGADGERLMTALAVAYQVHARLSDEAPVRQQGFDHTTQGAFAVPAGVAKALGLDAERTANAIAINGTASVALRVTRTGGLSHWKGLAYPHTAFTGTHAALLAMRGITGPAEVFEGNKGFKHSVSGPFEIDWEGEDLERVGRTIIKKYNAEIHSQTAIEGALELRREHGFDPAKIEAIRVDTFGVAHRIIGGGEEGEKTTVRNKEEADHSLHYMVAVALLDGALGPAQYLPERITADDVQALLRRVTVAEDKDYSAQFPDRMSSRVSVRLTDGRRYEIEKSDYEGFFTHPMSWDRVREKFDGLAAGMADATLRDEIADAVGRLDGIQVRELTELLGRAGKGV